MKIIFVRASTEWYTYAVPGVWCMSRVTGARAVHKDSGGVCDAEFSGCERGNEKRSNRYTARVRAAEAGGGEPRGRKSKTGTTGEKLSTATMDRPHT